MILSHENLLHASSFIMWVWSCEMFLSTLRDLLNLFDVGRDWCELGGKWVGSGKWESCQVPISLDITTPALQPSAGTRATRKQSREGCCWMTQQAWPPGPAFLMLPWALPSCNRVCLVLALGFCHWKYLFLFKIDLRGNSNTFGTSKCLLYKNHKFLPRVNSLSKKNKQ